MYMHPTKQVNTKRVEADHHSYKYNSLFREKDLPFLLGNCPLDNSIVTSVHAFFKCMFMCPINFK